MRSRVLQACPTAEELHSFLTCDLSETELERIGAHLDACAACRERIDASPELTTLATDLRRAARLREKTPVDVNVPVARLNALLTDYEIVEEIGRGGMGIVYRARQLKLNRLVAVKVLPALLGAVRPDAVQRFRREAELAARLKHSNIIAVHDYGEVDGTLYYAMELIEGRSLRDILCEIQETQAVDVVLGAGAAEPAAAAKSEASGEENRAAVRVTSSAPPTPKSALTKIGSSSRTDRAYYRRVAEWMAEVAEALDYAHQQGVIHRDIKPSNLLLHSDGRLMISDFGLARAPGAETLTASHALLGTARYMSPEQIDEDASHLDHRVDVYGLGATLYELLAFRPLFSGADDREVLAEVLNREPAPPRRFVRAVPQELETICLKAVEKNQAHRYQSAKAMADDLRRWLLDLPIRAKRPSVPARVAKYVRRKKASVALGAVAALLLVAAVSIYGAYTSSRRAAREALSDARAQRSQVICREAQTELFQGRFTEALDRVDAGLAHQPDSADLLRLRALILYHLGRENDALALYEQLLSRDPDDWRTHYGMTALLNTTQDRRTPPYASPNSLLSTIPAEERSERFAYHRAQVLRLKPDSTEACCLLANGEEDPHAAIALLDQVLERDSLSYEALMARCHRREQIGDFAAMLLDADRMAGIRPGWAIVQSHRGQALNALGRFAEAEQAYTRAIELKPGDAGVWHNRGQVKWRMGRHAEALADANEAIRLDPHFAYAYCGRARAQTGLGHLDRALADYDQAIELSPEDPEIHTGRGYASLEAGKPADAVVDFTRAIEHKPSQARAYAARGACYNLLKSYDRAITDLTHSLELEPGNARAYHNLGYAHALKGQYREAVDDFTKAIERERGPGDPEDLVDRALVLAYLGQYEAALDDLAKLIEIQPAPDVYLRRGMTYELAGAPRLALADYERVAKAGPPYDRYGEMWRCVLLRQTKPDRSGAQLPVSSDADTTGSGEWTDRLFRFLNGELTPVELLDAAAIDNERVEAYYYVGRGELLAGNAEEARAAFSHCLELDRADLPETAFARALLRQAEERTRAGEPQ